jgi:hypothetical protein
MPQRLLDPINVRLTPQMRKRLDELADERTVPMSVLIREALDLAYVLKSVPLSRGPREPTCDPPAVPLASCPESPSAGSWRLP